MNNAIIGNSKAGDPQIARMPQMGSGAARSVALFGAMYSRDWRQQLPALIAWRKFLISEVEENVATYGKSARRTRKLYNHRRMLKSYESDLARRQEMESEVAA